jgi:hypothetical protein
MVATPCLPPTVYLQDVPGPVLSGRTNKDLAEHVLGLKEGPGPLQPWQIPPEGVGRGDVESIKQTPFGAFWTKIDPSVAICQDVPKATSWKEVPPMGNFLLGVLMSTGV